MNMIAFITYCMIVTGTPGPTNIAILSMSTNAGIRKAFRYSMGAASALCILLLLSALFNSTLASVAPKIIIAMRCVGSLYMLYLARQVYKMDVSEDASGKTATFLSGFTMQFVNPKVWLLAMTVIPSYVLPHYTAPPILIGFCLAITAIALFSFALWTFFGRVLVRFLQKYRKAVNIGLALLLVYSAIEVSGVIELFMRE